MSKIIDISPEIDSSLAVFPGDTPFEREVAMSFDQGNHLTLSSIKSTVHLGAHTDAPNHYSETGEGIEAADLSTYYGECQVIEVRECAQDGRIPLKALKDTKILANKVLFKTNSFPDHRKWKDDFWSLSAELIDWLASKKVKLVGIDTPSIDPADSKELEAHQAVKQNDMRILEGILLAEVEEGLYTLIALPLKIKSADASPVRAVLIAKS